MASAAAHAATATAAAVLIVVFLAPLAAASDSDHKVKNQPAPPPTSPPRWEQQTGGARFGVGTLGRHPPGGDGVCSGRRGGDVCAVVPLDPCSPGWEGQICVARAPAGRDLRVASPSLVLDRGLVAWSLLEISPREW